MRFSKNCLFTENNAQKNAQQKLKKKKKIDETQKRKQKQQKTTKMLRRLRRLRKRLLRWSTLLAELLIVFSIKKTRQSLRLFSFIEKKQHAKSKRVFASLNASQNDSLLLAQRFENDLKQNQTRNHDFRHQRNNRIFLSRFQNWKFTTNVRWINEQTSNTSTTSNVFNSSC